MTPKELSQKARELVGEGWVLLDVRTPEEFRQGHPEPARNIPVQELSQRVAEVGPPGTRGGGGGARRARGWWCTARQGAAARWRRRSSAPTASRSSST